MINSSEWWQNSQDDVETRWCLFDDEYVFHADGTFENVFNGETWVQPWQMIVLMVVRIHSLISTR